MFTDKAEIELRAGKGGDGKMGFRHEKYRAKGGADGGDGGRGGSIIFESSHNQNTLSKYRTNRKVEAEDGAPGGGNRKAGKSGQDMIIRVPVGTVIYEMPQARSQTSNPGPTSIKDVSLTSNPDRRTTHNSPITTHDAKVLADLTDDGQQVVVAKGGRGGFGNAHFISSVRQTPHLAEKGEPGEKLRVALELKLVADVGLVGLPNAGKSTLLSVISNAKPEIADYPFTTLVPNLGVVDFEQNTFLVADIPGLIEGASEGKGLGDEFLRHIERTAVILHLISVDSNDIERDYLTIINELTSYSVDLTQRPQLVVLTKIETVTAEELKSQMEKLASVISRSQISNPDEQTILKRHSLSEDETNHKLDNLAPDREPSQLDPRSEAVDKANNHVDESDLSVEDDKTSIFAISAVAHRGLDVLLRRTAQLVMVAREARKAAAEAEPKAVIDQMDFPNLWKLEQEPDGSWRVMGGNIEGHGRRTDWDNQDAVERMRDILRKTGVGKELIKHGVEPGDIIRIGTNEMEWL